MLKTIIWENINPNTQRTPKYLRLSSTIRYRKKFTPALTNVKLIYNCTDPGGGSWATIWCRVQSLEKRECKTKKTRRKTAHRQFRRLQPKLGNFSECNSAMRSDDLFATSETTQSTAKAATDAEQNHQHHSSNKDPDNGSDRQGEIVRVQAELVHHVVLEVAAFGSAGRCWTAILQSFLLHHGCVQFCPDIRAPFRSTVHVSLHLWDRQGKYQQCHRRVDKQTRDGPGSHDAGNVQSGRDFGSNGKDGEKLHRSRRKLASWFMYLYCRQTGEKIKQLNYASCLV